MHLPEHIFEGRHEPLGAHARTEQGVSGVNFAVFSENAEKIELCIFDSAGQREITRYALNGPHDGVFHGFLPGLQPGLVYGLRAHGPYAPREGHRFNPNKLLLDPNAREIIGNFRWRAEHHGYEIGNPEGPRSFDTRDNAVHALKARVSAPLTDIGLRTNAPRHDAADLVLYEVHVKGFSMLHADIPAELRGTYAGLAHPAAIAHFKSLGVTTLSLLPVQYSIAEPHLADKQLPNYWGYNTLGFFCPDPRLALLTNREDPSAVTEEFRDMVRALHAAGIEVVLDVVYNHTPEGNEFGPRCLSAAWTTRVGTACKATTRAAMKTSPAAVTPCTARTRASRSSCSIRCAIGSRTWASTVSASTWRRCWAARTRASIPTRPSSPRCARTRSWPACT